MEYMGSLYIHIERSAVCIAILPTPHTALRLARDFMSVAIYCSSGFYVLRRLGKFANYLQENKKKTVFTWHRLCIRDRTRHPARVPSNQE